MSFVEDATRSAVMRRFSDILQASQMLARLTEEACQKHRSLQEREQALWAELEYRDPAASAVLGQELGELETLRRRPLPRRGHQEDILEFAHRLIISDEALGPEQRRTASNSRVSAQQRSAQVGGGHAAWGSGVSSERLPTSQGLMSQMAGFVAPGLGTRLPSSGVSPPMGLQGPCGHSTTSHTLYAAPSEPPASAFFHQSQAADGHGHGGFSHHSSGHVPPHNMLFTQTSQNPAPGLPQAQDSSTAGTSDQRVQQIWGRMQL